MSEEALEFDEMARRVLQAVAVEAYGRPEAYVTRERVMARANVADLARFLAIAEYLEDKGWIAESAADYGLFAVSAEGIQEATD